MVFGNICPQISSSLIPYRFASPTGKFRQVKTAADKKWSGGFIRSFTDEIQFILPPRLN